MLNFQNIFESVPGSCLILSLDLALSLKQGGNIPAIALTAHAGEIDYQQAMAAGFQQHIAKPVEPGALILAVVALTERNANN